MYVCFFFFSSMLILQRYIRVSAHSYSSLRSLHYNFAIFFFHSIAAFLLVLFCCNFGLLLQVWVVALFLSLFRLDGDFSVPFQNRLYGLKKENTKTAEQNQS